jgi:hypothetical protein
MMGETGQSWFVRPVAAVAAGGDGASYERAWRGWGAIQWVKVRPGDTLWVCGEHLWQRDWKYNRGYENRVQASGEPGARVIVRGDWPGDPGVMIGARRVSAEFRAVGDGTWRAPYSVPTGATGSFRAAWQGPAAGGRLLKRVTGAPEEGSFWWDSAEKLLTIRPWGGKIEDVYGNWVSALVLDGVSHVEVRGLRLFGGYQGVIQIAKNATSKDVAIIGCELGFADYTAVYANAPTDGVLIEDCLIHDAATGTYAIGYRGATHRGWTLRRVEVRGGGDAANLLASAGVTKSDRHALGGQNMSGLLVEACQVRDWPGDGVIDYLASGPINDVTVRDCLFERLRDPERANYHYGVAKHGTNALFAYHDHSGWVIEGNVFSELQGGQGAGSGIAVRVKGGAEVRGNVFHRCGQVYSMSPAGPVVQDGNVRLADGFGF